MASEKRGKAAAAVDAKETPKSFASPTKLASFGAPAIPHLRTLAATAGVGLKITPDEFGMLPLCHAARAGDLDMVRHVLAELKADINETGWGGLTALMFAALSNADAVVTELLTRGAAPDRADDAGNTALHYAVQGGQLGCMNPIIVEGGPAALAGSSTSRSSDVRYTTALVNVKNAAGRTPLHAAANHGQLVAVTLLLRAGADVHVADAKGNTALHIASAAGFAKVCSTLIAAGAKRDATNADGATPAQIASTAACEKACTA